MEVILTKEGEASLREFIYNLAKEEFSKAKDDLAIGRPINQTEIAEFFGVSTTTIRAWEQEGMPHGSMGSKSKFYDAQECKRWVLNQKR